IHSHTPQLLGRKHELAELTRFATGTEGYRWLRGAAFAGKTSLVAEAVMTTLPSSVDVVAYFLSRRADDSDGNHFLAAVVPQLAPLLGRPTPPVPDVHQFRALWVSAAEHAAVVGRHLLLVVDGLDEDLHTAGVPSVASLLPRRAGGNSHVLVTSRPIGVPDDVPIHHALRQIQPVTLEPSGYFTLLERQARQEIIGLRDGGVGHGERS